MKIHVPVNYWVHTEINEESEIVDSRIDYSFDSQKGIVDIPNSPDTRNIAMSHEYHKITMRLAMGETVKPTDIPKNQMPLIRKQLLNIAHDAKEAANQFAEMLGQDVKPSKTMNTSRTSVKNYLTDRLLEETGRVHEDKTMAIAEAQLKQCKR